MIADCHVHSVFSSDSQTPVTEILNCAIAQNMKYFYLTDHHDIDFPIDAAEGLTFQLDTPAYLTCLEELRHTCQDKITVRKGVELGLMAHIADKLDAYVSEYDFDFIIGSSHLVRGTDPYYPEFYQGRSQKEAYREYFESIYENAKVFHNYDVYGHLDYVVRYGPTQNKDWDFKDYADIFEAIFQLLIPQGKGIEINTAGLYKGLGYPHPHRDILSMYKNMGGEIITVGSDAHQPQYFAYGFDSVEALLKSCGFHYYCVFSNRKPEFIPIT